MQNGKVKVERVVCAVDCGVAVNPDIMRAQMEGCIGFALGALYYGEIEVKNGRAAQRKTFEGAWLEVRYSDGSSARAVVDQFLGTPANPMSDRQLDALFVSASAGLLPSAQARAVLDAVWALDSAPGLAPLMALLRLQQGETR